VKKLVLAPSIYDNYTETADESDSGIRGFWNLGIEEILFIVKY